LQRSKRLPSEANDFFRQFCVDLSVRVISLQR
jgi:hypothetical protein